MHTKSLSSIVDTAQPYLAAVIGNIICGLGINAFFIPHHLLSSGLSGIAIIIYYAVGFPVGTVVFILNIPIMLACYKYMGRKYTLISLIGTVLFSASIDLTAYTSQWVIIKDPILSGVAGGLMTGLGFGILYKYDVNSGGMDVVAAIVKKILFPGNGQCRHDYKYTGTLLLGIHVFFRTGRPYIYCHCHRHLYYQQSRYRHETTKIRHYYLQPRRRNRQYSHALHRTRRHLYLRARRLHNAGQTHHLCRY